MRMHSEINHKFGPSPSGWRAYMDIGVDDERVTAASLNPMIGGAICSPREIEQLTRFLHHYKPCVATLTRRNTLKWAASGAEVGARLARHEKHAFSSFEDVPTLSFNASAAGLAKEAALLWLRHLKMQQIAEQYANEEDAPLLSLFYEDIQRDPEAVLRRIGECVQLHENWPPLLNGSVVTTHRHHNKTAELHFVKVVPESLSSIIDNFAVVRRRLELAFSPCFAALLDEQRPMIKRLRCQRDEWPNTMAEWRECDAEPWRSLSPAALCQFSPFQALKTEV